MNNTKKEICIHYNKKTDKYDMPSCTYNKRDPDGFCTCHGEGIEGHRSKKYHNYLCSSERVI